MKTKIYARFGVEEMWIADPDAKTISVLTNSGEGFRQEDFLHKGEILRSPLLPGLAISLDEVF